MLNLYDGMLLYHGSYAQVSVIDLSMCKKGKDFGKGFYLTSSYEQARQFVKLSIKRESKAGIVAEGQDSGFVSVFKLDLTPAINSFWFAGATREWLHFVASNRRPGLFDSLSKDMAKYDIIGGKIANDRTAQTLQLYISGAYGEPGSEIADNIAIMTLLPNRLEDQFCFRTATAVNALEFVRGDECYVG